MVSDEQKTSKIDTIKIKHIEYQFVAVVVMTNKISKTSRFPRRSRPVARPLHREDPPQLRHCFPSPRRP
ncbi:hypothetical protein DMY82_00885 [Shigella sonnei]|nr:hypothetical protein [Shigella sonnei]EFX2240262.1 hypothetical protein [Shigella sonnei]EGE1393779.1 hypothetical protein [Shigella sonnei]EGE1786822.1 hypothetical protein [Shigella sonnei]MXE02246.1 hypothetical protein [Escherichia coli]